MTPKSGDFIEVVTDGKPYNTKVVVNGEDIANHVSDIHVDIDPARTVLTLSMDTNDHSHIEVRGFLVTEEEMKAYLGWRADGLVADIVGGPKRTREVLESLMSGNLESAIDGFAKGFKAE